MPPNRILIVDDEVISRKWIESMLDDLGYDIRTAVDGEDALAKIEEQVPDLILLDIMMPKINGLEVIKHLKAKPATQLIPIVIITSHDERDHRIKSLEAGADDFLGKPLDSLELTARVKSLLKVKAYNDHMHQYQKKLEEDIRDRTKQLNSALDELKTASLDTIVKLSRAAEYKDEDTAAHIERMSHFSAIIAGKMGLSPMMVESILYASPMHDIGKIGIPDSILLKPGKLTLEEMKVIQQHTHIGAKILEGSHQGFLSLAEIIAYTHHEKWDGTGYPRGLKGDRIPLAGRIAAISDVFDALTSKRPYKEAYSLEKSFEIIRESNGTHFDPKVVEAFFNAKDEILYIRQIYIDKGDSLLVRMYSGID